MDIVQFDELIRNMSQFMEIGEVSDDFVFQLIYQLVVELVKVQLIYMQWWGIQEEMFFVVQFRGEIGSVF